MQHSIGHSDYFPSPKISLEEDVTALLRGSNVSEGAMGGSGFRRLLCCSYKSFRKVARPKHIWLQIDQARWASQSTILIVNLTCNLLTQLIGQACTRLHEKAIWVTRRASWRRGKCKGPCTWSLIELWRDGVAYCKLRGEKWTLSS